MSSNSAHRHVLSFVLALRPAAIALLAAAWLLYGSALVHAGRIEVHVTGLDLRYNGTEIVDAASAAGGGGDPALADSLAAMSFFYDGTLLGTLSTLAGDKIYGDVLIKNLAPIPAGGGPITSVGGGNNDTFGFDLLIGDTAPAWGLALNLGTVEGWFGTNGLFLAVSGVASSLPAQNLPFLLEIDENEQISFVFSSTSLSNVTSAGGIVTGFQARGTAQVDAQGIVVPEPSSAVLAVLGMVGLGWAARRRRAQAA
jgi:hypothetical protein